jgi:hypothetical protein
VKATQTRTVEPAMFKVGDDLALPAMEHTNVSMHH